MCISVHLPFSLTGRGLPKEEIEQSEKGRFQERGCLCCKGGAWHQLQRNRRCTTSIFTNPSLLGLPFVSRCRDPIQLVKAKRNMLAHLTESPRVFLTSSIAGHRDSDVTGLVSVCLSFHFWSLLCFLGMDLTPSRLFEHVG